jgi:Uma2 family endonuclease
MVSAQLGVAPKRMMDDFHAALGGVPLSRICMTPPPGTATVADLVRALHHERRRCELVDGTLVEKPMGFKESALASRLGKFIDRWNDARGEPGVVTGEGGPMMLMKGLVRLPDLAFTFYSRFPNNRLPSAAVPDLAPDLAVEVLSASNTPAEMERKLKEYFLSEVQQVWFIDPKTRTVTVYTSPDDATTLGAKDALTGGTLLPGFALELSVLFERLPDDDPPHAPPTAPAKPAKKPKKRK